MEAPIPYDSNGNATVTRDVAVTGQTVQAAQVNVPFADIQAMLSQVLLRSGVAPMSGNLNLNGFRMTNVANGSAPGDAVNFFQLSSLLSAVSPTGSVTMFASGNIPTGWLRCNGQAVSRTTYSALFTIIGTLWGEGDGATTFNLPDLRGEFVRGFDEGRGVDPGRIFATVQQDQIEAHTHTGETNVDGTHGHDLQLWFGSGGTHNTGGGSLFGGSAPAGDVTGGAHKHAFTTGSTGGTETRPRNVTMIYIIKT